MKNLGEFFKECRVEAHRTLEEVASSLEIPMTDLRDYETGVRDLPFDMVFALANVLNIRPNEVIRIVQSLTAELGDKRRVFLGDVSRSSAPRGTYGKW